MLLTEYEAKKLLALAKLQRPTHFLVTADFETSSLEDKLGSLGSSGSLGSKYYVKAQVLHGNRAEQGLVIPATIETLNTAIKTVLGKKDQHGQSISSVLVEQKVTIEQSIYISLRYDTVTRQLVCLYSDTGGTGMDERGDTLQKVPLSVLKQPSTFNTAPELLTIVQKLWQVFTTNDATLVEINPLAKTDSPDEYICLDAKIELDDAAKFRHPEWSEYPERSAFGRPPTQLEKQALQISRSDHRGVAGESFFELPGGEIGVMASGGGASTLAMDALLAAGVKPANYTEYSGNPSREKVHALTNIVLTIPNLKGLYVVGSNANFTDIYETLAGVVDGLLESDYLQTSGITSQQLKPFAVLIRRGGPRWQEAFTMVEERLAEKIKANQVKIKLCGPDFPLLDTAQEMKNLLA
jgi:succinyl-CoA synthetase beta subunit